MTTTEDRTDPTSSSSVLRAGVPADVEAPDRVLGDLTARQVAVLAVGAALGYLAWRAVHARVPVLVLVAAGVPVAGATLALAIGRRDGLALEVWLAHAARYRRAPRRLLPVRVPPAPAWAPATPRSPAPGLLRLPVGAITPDGTIHPTGRRPGRARSSHISSAVTLVGACTVNLTMRSPNEQASLITGFARWLNGLTTPVQVVICDRRVDLTGHALRIADTVHLTGDPALATAGLDYAEFLLDLVRDRDPLARTVTIAATASGPDAGAAARRAGEHTAGCMTALGAQAAVLDGPAATAALTAAVDPYQATDAAWPRAVPSIPITTRTPKERP
jgi:hypothetical protein